MAGDPHGGQVKFVLNVPARLAGTFDQKIMVMFHIGQVKGSSDQ